MPTPPAPIPPDPSTDLPAAQPPAGPPARELAQAGSRRRFLGKLASSATLLAGGVVARSVVASGGLLAACSGATSTAATPPGADSGGQKDGSGASGGEDVSVAADAVKTDSGSPDVTQADAAQADAAQADAAQADGGSADIASGDSQGADAEGTCSTAPTGAPQPCHPTGADVEGPYYEANAPSTITLAGANEPGERLRVQGRVYALGCGSALAKTTIEVWHADKDGKYRDLGHATPLRATLAADCSGRFSFDTIMPGAYLDVGGYRPQHIHFRVTTPAGKVLITQLYFEGDPYLAPKDSCGVCKSDDSSHIVKLNPMGAGKKGSVAVFNVVV